ncbi:hypothetical protein [Synergistes jonesii]|uniref:Uncharacterized protein n=1 Tax=Synergistes jonesii TaxID=2754 RepID=A0A073J1W3_9BACT|nr:hypothetical protein [Synergistes jonesii]KEJ91697.1 hypothetical protein EH55_06890 [Synergistes jonesii]MDY2985888.1 hypothetical protein [Synergistes jonesii]OFB61772.1 hypothetical protein JS73_09000 [Synergistes jonesii]OFB64136.1 hypothetical protein JS72_05465 [Synergistes jonesii]OFB67273.1 hypothetical protein JS78_09010 [Synergistes jonesii]
MPGTREFPTLEKYTAETIDSFKAMWPKLSDDEVNAYFATEEATSLIKRRFDNGSDPYAAGYCLAMMY